MDLGAGASIVFLGVIFRMYVRSFGCLIIGGKGWEHITGSRPRVEDVLSAFDFDLFLRGGNRNVLCANLWQYAGTAEAIIRHRFMV